MILLLLLCINPLEIKYSNLATQRSDALLMCHLYVPMCSLENTCSLFKLKLFGSFALNGPHMSLPGQLMFNAQYLVRLQFPLGYNFLTMLRNSSSSLELVAFNKLMSNMAVSRTTL